MKRDNVLTLVADIVSAYVRNNRIAPDQLPDFVEATYSTIDKLGRSESAVPVDDSIRPDAITCLECGASYKMLKWHLMNAHDLTPAAYKARWNLPADYPIVAAKSSTQRKDHAQSIGLGSKVVRNTLKKNSAAKP